ncbi:MAG: TonB family protein [Blastocatellia bacterium]
MGNSISRYFSRVLLLNLFIFALVQLAEAQLPPFRIIPVSENTLRENVIDQVPPPYPTLARAGHISGTVTVEIAVDDRGYVSATKLIAGHPLLREAVITALKNWRFKPTQVGAETVGVIGKLSFYFSEDGSVTSEKEATSKIEQESNQAERIASLQQDIAQLLYQLGSAYSAQKQFHEAIDTYKKALEYKVDMPELYNNLGWAFSELEREEEAIAAFRQAILLKPAYALAQHNLAGSLYKLRRFAETIDAYRRVLEVDPNYQQAATVLTRIAYCYAELKNHTEAKKAFEQALKVNPNDFMALNNYGYYLLEQDEPLDKVLEVLKRAESRNSTDPHLLDSLAWAYFKLGSLDEAEKYIRKSLNYGGNSAEIYNHLGDIHKKRGREEEARAAWEKALTLSKTPEQKTWLNKKLGIE